MRETAEVVAVRASVTEGSRWPSLRYRRDFGRWTKIYIYIYHKTVSPTFLGKVNRFWQHRENGDMYEAGFDDVAKNRKTYLKTVLATVCDKHIDGFDDINLQNKIGILLRF